MVQCVCALVLIIQLSLFLSIGLEVSKTRYFVYLGEYESLLHF